MSNTLQIKLHEHCEMAYKKYAHAVVSDRALPSVQDGQKPVHRRILYAMQKLNLTPTGKHVKSARVVGDVLGKYHPHGDQSVYDALVRMAQDFSLRYPVIDGQGNFGSRDGDGAAAMRYTEIRLQGISALLLSELGRGTVEFKPNYDGQDQEPSLLPARLPFLLINGAEGIAVGMACDIPPHNLSEVTAAAVMRLKKPNSTLQEVMSILPAPDFPDGGKIISSAADLAQMYETGRGSIKMRCTWKKEDLARGQWQIVITALPYHVNVKRILEQIEALANPQPASNKKTITPAQANNRQLALNLLDKAQDESSQQEPVRLVISPKTSKIDPEELMAFLYANTDLQANTTFNMTVIGIDGKPQTAGLISVLSQWNQFRVQTVRNRCEHELAECLDRIEILQGRMIVFLNIDEVINIIRTEDEPKEVLMKRFSLTERQAEDILEIRLRQLAKLEGIKIEAELKDKQAQADKLKDLLANEPKLIKLVISELEQDAKQFADERRTQLEQVTETVAPKAVVLDEPVTIILSKNMLIKARAGHDVEASSLTFKTNDGLLGMVKTRTPNSVILLDINGRAYSLKGSEIPSSRGDGVPLSTLLDVQAPIAAIFSGSASDLFLFSGANGYGFISSVEGASTRQKAGKAFMSLETGEAMGTPVGLGAKAEDQWILVVTSNSRLLVFAASEAKRLEKGGKGVVLMGLDEKASVTAIYGLGDGQGIEQVLEITTENGKSQQWSVAQLVERFKAARGKKGGFLDKKAKIQNLTWVAAHNP